MKLTREQKEFLNQYNNKLITYEIEKKIMRKFLLDNRFQLIEMLKSYGYFLLWQQNKCNAKGKKVYVLIEKVKK